MILLGGLITTRGFQWFRSSEMCEPHRRNVTQDSGLNRSVLLARTCGSWILNVAAHGGRFRRFLIRNSDVFTAKISASFTPTSCAPKPGHLANAHVLFHLSVRRCEQPLLLCDACQASLEMWSCKMAAMNLVRLVCLRVYKLGSSSTGWVNG